MIEEEASQEKSKEESGLTAIARIRELELQLEKVSAEAENNKVATRILNSMIDKGEAMQNPDGSVQVVRGDGDS